MKFRVFLFFVLATALLSACFSPRIDHTQYYLLSTSVAVSNTAAVQSDKVFLLGLRMTSVEYLRTKQMLVEVGANQLNLSEDNVWEETPQAGFARVMTSRFARKAPDCQLTPLPSATANSPELILEIELRSMQGRLNPEREAEVSAEVRILDAKSHLLERDDLRQTSPWSPTTGPESYPALAAAESVAAAELADAIAEKVMACHRKLSGP
jgi:uncharacterized lipoprotein YmbA